MLVSGNMTRKNMGRNVGEKIILRKILPHILFNDPFVSHSTTKKQRCGRSEEKNIFKNIFSDPVVYICKVNC